MPGIVGFISQNGAAQHRQDIQRMACMLRMGLPDVQTEDQVTDSHADDCAGLASVFQPEIGAPLAVGRATPDGPKIWLVAYGDVIFEDARDHTSPCALSQRLLNHYLAGGIEAVCGLNGLYTLAIYEEGSGRLTLVTDRYGYGKLYYWHAGQRLMFASEYKAITWHPAFPRALDETAVADLFLYRAPIEGRSMFAGIRLLPAAGILTFQQGTASVRRYWKPVFASPGNLTVRDEDHAGALAERMRVAIRRRARPDTTLLITGGLDSRIVAELYRQEAPEAGLSTMTLGDPTGGDVVVGRAISAALGFDHQHIAVDSCYLAQYAEAAVWKAETKNGAYAAWIAAAAPHLQRRSQRYVMTGLYGNFISGRHYPPGTSGVRTVQEGVRVVQFFQRPYLAQLGEIMRPNVFNRAGQDSAASLERIYRAAAGDHPVQRMDDFTFHFRIGRQATTLDSLNDAAMALEPYLDNDVFDYATGAVAPQTRLRGLINLHLVENHLPVTARIALSNNGRRIAEEIALQRSPLRQTWDMHLQRIRRRLKIGAASPHPRAIQHAEAIRAGSRAFVCDLLNQKASYDDLFDPAAVLRMLDDHLAGRGNYYMPIDSLVTFILWRKRFCA